MKAILILLFSAGIVISFSSCKKNEIDLSNSSVYVGEQILVRKIVFINPSTGYACGGIKGSRGCIFKTSNSGKSWQLIYSSDSEEIFDVFFVNDSLGFACGDNLTMLKTTSAGANWFSVNSTAVIYKAPSFPLRRIFFTDSLNGYIAGGQGFDKGITFRTVNGGVSWLYTTYSRELRDLSFSNPSNGFVCGYGIVMKTSDGDLTTSASDVKGDFFTCLCRTPGDVLFVGGYAGGIYRSSDSGATWTKVYSSSCNFNSICFTSDLTGYAVGNNGVLVYTLNGGASWKTVKPFTGLNLYTVCATTAGQLLTGSDNGTVYLVNP